MNTDEAIKEAQTILREEANVVACCMGKEPFENLPHRAKVGIRREMERLRLIAETLKQLEKPKPEDVEEGG